MTESRQPQDPAMAVTWLCECGTQVKSDRSEERARDSVWKGLPREMGVLAPTAAVGVGWPWVSHSAFRAWMKVLLIWQQGDGWMNGPCRMGRGAFNPVCQARVMMIRTPEFDSDCLSWEKEKSVSPHDSSHNSPPDKQGP